MKSNPVVSCEWKKKSRGLVSTLTCVSEKSRKLKKRKEEEQDHSELF